MSFFHDAVMDTDQKEVAAGDTLDVKAGILLALIAVLASINGVLLAYPHLTKRLVMIQLTSLMAAALAALLTFASLIHWAYDRPISFSAYKAYLEKLEALKIAAVDAAVNTISTTTVREAWARIEKNSSINRGRRIRLLVAFLAAALALSLDIITLGFTAIIQMRS